MSFDNCPADEECEFVYVRFIAVAQNDDCEIFAQESQQDNIRTHDPARSLREPILLSPDSEVIDPEAVTVIVEARLQHQAQRLRFYQLRSIECVRELK